MKPNKKQLRVALQAYKDHEKAMKASSIVVKGYPYSHNPYIPHTPVEDCYSGCVHLKDWHGLDGPIYTEGNDEA